MELTIEEVIRSTHGNLCCLTPKDLITTVVIDSRKATKNTLFIALKGDNFDGHDYIVQVLSEPSNYVLATQAKIKNHPRIILVNDAILALGNLAHYYRQKFPIPIIAITGSNGKTTLKEMLKAIFERAFNPSQVLATEGNLNNHLGLPLTILKLRPEHKIALLEMGMNHSGEIKYLVDIARPTHALINNVFPVHIGNFENIYRLAQAKIEIFSHLEANNVAFIDLSSSYLELIKPVVANVKQVNYNSETSDYYIKKLTNNTASYHTKAGDLPLKLKLLGKHNYHNAMSAIVIAVNLGLDLNTIKTSLESLNPYPRRLEIKRAFNGAVIIDDSYNASPSSVIAALEAVSDTPELWLVFGDLKELGKEEIKLHEKLGASFNNYPIKRLLTVGELAKFSAKYFKADKIHFQTNADVVKYCVTNLNPQVTILVKASNSMRFDEIINGLQF